MQELKTVYYLTSPRQEKGLVAVINDVVFCHPDDLERFANLTAKVYNLERYNPSTVTPRPTEPLSVTVKGAVLEWEATWLPWVTEWVPPWERNLPYGYRDKKS